MFYWKQLSKNKIITRFIYKLKSEEILHTIIKDIEEKFVNLQEIIQKQAETIYNLEESSFLVKKDVLKTYSKNFKFSF